MLAHRKDAPMESGIVATATCVGSRWRIDVPEFGGTWCRRLTEVPSAVAAMAAEAGRAVTPEQVRVTLSGELGALVTGARDAVRRAERAQREAARASRELVRELLADGCSQADVAVVLGVSNQRVSQLAHPKEPMVAAAADQAS